MPIQVKIENDKGVEELVWRLNETDLRIVSYIEENYWLNGTTPPVGNISKALDLDPKVIDGCLKHPTTCEYLGQRGVENPLFESVDASGLTPQQLFVANVILNAMDKKSLREKLKMCNISVQQYYAWMTPGSRFQAYIQARSERVLYASDWLVNQSLVEQAENGNIQAIKFYKQLTGRYVETQNVNVNFDAIIPQIAEIVSQYVNRDQMLEIANKIEYLMQHGQIPQESNVLELPSVEV